MFINKCMKQLSISQILNDRGYDIPKASGLSYRFNKKRVRFETVVQILDYLGYENRCKGYLYEKGFKRGAFRYS